MARQEQLIPGGAGRTFQVWLLVGCAAFTSLGQEPREDEYYRIQRVPIPQSIVLEVGATEVMPDNRLAVATRRGEIWLVDGALGEGALGDGALGDGALGDGVLGDGPRTPQFKRFAHGLHEVLGLFYQDGALYATQRGELTRIRDIDGDGEADLFETVCDGWSISGDYHEYAFGSRPDRKGDVWIALCLTGSFTSDVPYRGWCVRVTPDGQMIPTCSGLRSPGGIGFDASGEVFYTDNQGPWNGTCSLKRLRPGSFLGNPAGNRWYSLTDALGPPPREPRSGSRMMVEAASIPELEPPAVYFPYQKMGQSASGIACDTTGGKFGPFAGQLFVGDQTHSTVMRVFLEKVQGHYQGACFPFLAGFGSGTLALRMTEGGSLIVGGTNRGWGSRGPLPYALERVDWTGRLPFEVLDMRVQSDGFKLTFTEPLAADSANRPESYALETYTYIYQSSYGSPEVDRTNPKITHVDLSADGRTVQLRVEKLAVGHVHELHLDGIRSEDGRRLLHREVYYTLNYLPQG